MTILAILGDIFTLLGIKMEKVGNCVLFWQKWNFSKIGGKNGGKNTPFGSPFFEKSYDLGPFLKGCLGSLFVKLKFGSSLPATFKKKGRDLNFFRKKVKKGLPRGQGIRVWSEPFLEVKGDFF